MPEVLLPYEGDTYLYKYVPKLSLSATAAGLWLILTVFLAWRMCKTRTWFCSAFVAGCLMEIIGYCGRAVASNMTNNLIADIIQATFILLPPAFFAATIYMCLSRIIHHVGGEHLSIVPARWLTRLFVGGDMVSIGIQGAVANPKFGNIGKWLIVVALIIQLIFFGLFGLTALIFHTRIRKSPTEKLSNVDRSWISTMFMLYGISGLIILRSIFRVVEYVMGTNGYPLTHEWTLYAFDTLPMLNVALAFCLWYPSNLSETEYSDIQLDNRVSE